MTVRAAAWFSAFVACLALAAPARADDLRWRDEWAHFRTSEYVATGAMGAGIVTLYLMPRVQPRWGAPLLFDVAAREAFLAQTPRGRKLGAALSTFSYYALLFEPIVMQGPVVPLLRGSSEVAAQVTLINLQSLALTAFIFRTTEVLVARARPYVWDCIKREGSAEKCREHGVGGTNSFISGHAAIAATGAALICTNQYHLRIYGTIGGAVACGLGIAAGITAGVGRIVSDNHYATDVFMGWLIGAASGFLLPSLLHYGFDGRGVGEARTASSAQPIMFTFGGAL